MWFEIFSLIAKSIVTRTNAPPGVVMACIERLRDRRDLSAESPARNRWFQYGGEVKNCDFTICPRLPIRHGGYRLTLRGRVEAVDGGSQVVILIRARLWLVMLVPVAWMEWSTLNSHDDLPWLAPAFWGVYHSLGSLIVWWQVRGIRQDLESVLRG